MRRANLASDATRTDTTLLERALERERLDDLVGAAARGQGGVAVIEGPAGIGKSALLDAAVAQARDAGLRALTARGSALETTHPLGVVLQLVAPLQGELAGDDEVFGGAAAAARPLVEGTAPPPGAAGDGEPAFALIHGLHWLIANLADRAPVLLVVDDAHWSDGLSLRFLDYLAHRVADIAACLVVSLRTGEEPADSAALASLTSRPDAATLRPRPLSEAAVAELVRDRVKGADDAFCLACHRATAGNPFYVHELLAAATESGLAPGAADVVEGLGPASISRSLLARLGRMSAPSRELAFAVAVAGDGTSLGLAARVADTEPGDASRAADELAVAEILTHGEPLSFVHPIVREAVYGDLPAATRAERHLEVARLLFEDGAPPDAVAGHLLSAPRGRRAWVVVALRAAADHARARGAPEIAARYLERAIEEGGLADRRGPVLIDLGLAMTLAGDPSGAERITEGIDAIDDPGQRGAGRIQLAKALGVRGGYADAARLCERAAADFAALPPEVGADLVNLARVGYATTGAHDVETRDEALPVLHELAARPGIEATAPGRSVLAFEAVEGMYTGRPAAEVVSLAEKTVAADLGDEVGEEVGFRMAASALAMCDELDMVADAARRLSEWARARGSSVEEAGAASLRAVTALRRGAVDRLAVEAQAAVDGFRVGYAIGLPSAHAALAVAHIERGEPSDAAAALELPGGERRWSGASLFFFWAEVRAYLRLMEGDAEGALSGFERAAELRDRVGAENPAMSHLSARQGMALAMHRLGQPKRAAELAAADLQLAERFGTPRPIGMALRTSGLVTGGKRGIGLLERSVAALESSPGELELARSLTELGAALRRGGRRRDSREPLRRGLDLARRLGGLALAERAHTELRASGARPRKLDLTGVESLTPSERRVAELAARGLTNKDIAQELYVTVKTVETHLGHVYGKLEVTSRRDLPAALGEESG